MDVTKEVKDIAASTATSVTITTVVVPTVLSTAGFTSGGITSGSLGAYAMSWYGGSVASGSLISICQSVGAVGLGLSPVLLIPLTGGIYGAKKLYDYYSQEDETEDGPAE